jgi:uncharacterized protein YdeI (YjbR/CyaY-like superfamily)
MQKTKSVKLYIDQHPQWQESLLILKELIDATELHENIKWGAPVYTLNNKNIVGIAAFKKYVGLWFHQGALLKDLEKKLINAQEGVTKALRQWRFSSAEEIVQNSNTIKTYLKEAIENHKQGKVIKPEKNKALIIPSELSDLFIKNKNVKDKFDLFSLSKQREFTQYISEAKRADTKFKRLNKITPMILNGIGLNDKYRK